MKQLNILLIVIATLILTQNAVSQINKPVKKQLAYEISAQRIGSGDILEFTPMKIEFTLTVTTIGIAGPEPMPIDISVCPAIMPLGSEYRCAQIPKAKSGGSYRRTMTVPAPQAGTQSPLRIVVLAPASTTEEFGQKIAVGETDVKVDVAARYDVSIAKFEVLSTRSTSADTVWLSLQGLIKSNPPHASADPEASKLAGFNWLIFNQKHQNQSNGDVKDGIHNVNNLRVGPYDLVPEREKDLRIIFYLHNHGGNASRETALAVGNAFSKIGMIILSGYGAASGNGGITGFAKELDTQMQRLHSTATASCDGKLASDVVIIANTTIANQPQNTLDAFTKNSGEFINTVPTIYREKDGDFICYRGGGQYKVTYGVHRTSWQEWGFRPRW